MRDSIELPRKIAITTGGGFGDQICVEPVLRFMTNGTFRNDDIIVQSHFPFLFEHLPVKPIGDKNFNYGEMRLCINTHPTETEQNFIYDCIHPVDFIALKLLRRTLPNSDKTIRISVAAENVAKAKNLVGEVGRAVLIHPGISWQSKTLPADVWQSYIDCLTRGDRKVIVIGSNTMETNAPKGVHSLNTGACVDLVDKIDAQTLIALISIVPVLITNDSAPLHIAGAFDNWIGVIATAKRPDYILPFRHGRQDYKAKALEKHAVYEELEFDPLKFHTYDRTSVPEESLRRASPLPEEILAFVESCHV